jgi:hypothetical protein
MHEKILFFDSGETQRSGGTRNKPFFQFNQNIYANAVFINKVSFINRIPNLDYTIQLQLTFTNTTASKNSVKTITFLGGEELTIDHMIRKMNQAVKEYMSEESVATKVYFISNFHSQSDRIGFVPVSSAVGGSFGYSIAGEFILPSSSSNANGLHQLREMFNLPYDSTLTTSSTLEWFDTQNDFPRTTNLGTSVNSDLSDEGIYATVLPFSIDTNQPKYLFLHSNINTGFSVAHQLKVGDRDTSSKNDVIAIIPITVPYGSYMVYEENQNISLERAINTSDNCLNQVEFYFTRRQFGRDAIEVDFDGRTFQVQIKYFTQQLY